MIGSVTGLGACIALGVLLANERFMLKISTVVEISIALQDHILHILNACFIDIRVAMDQELRFEPMEVVRQA